MLTIALAVLVAAPVAAQTQNSPSDRVTTKEQRAARAKERCKLNHGVDCDTPEGLKEWLLQERSRQEAIRDRRLPTQPAPATSPPWASTQPPKTATGHERTFTWPPPYSACMFTRLRPLDRSPPPFCLALA